MPAEWFRIPTPSSGFKFLALVSALHRNLLLLSFNDAPATKSLVQLSAPEAESIVDYFLATMYGGQEASYAMNGNMIESSMIPGSTGISSSPTMIQQHSSDLYSNGGANMIASLRTHSSKFPVSRHTQHALTWNLLERGWLFNKRLTKAELFVGALSFFFFFALCRRSENALQHYEKSLSSRLSASSVKAFFITECGKSLNIQRAELLDMQTTISWRRNITSHKRKFWCNMAHHE